MAIEMVTLSNVVRLPVVRKRGRKVSKGPKADLVWLHGKPEVQRAPARMDPNDEWSSLEELAYLARLQIRALVAARIAAESGED